MHLFIQVGSKLTFLLPKCNSLHYMPYFLILCFIIFWGGEGGAFKLYGLELNAIEAGANSSWVI